jgi:hypothetical protein
MSTNIEYITGTSSSAMSKKERKKEIERFFNDVILPQRNRLRQSRDHTLISSGSPTQTGHRGELLASLVTGVKGRSRNGKTGSKLRGDLTDNTEVKSVNTADVGIDYFVHGKPHKFNDFVLLEMTKPDEYKEFTEMEGIRTQIEDTTCIIHLCEKKVGGGVLGTEHLFRVTKMKKTSQHDILNKLNVPFLKQVLTKCGLPTNGLKSALVQRIETFRSRNTDANLNKILEQMLPEITNDWCFWLNDTDAKKFPTGQLGKEGIYQFRLEGSHLNYSNKTPKQMKVILQDRSAISWTYLDLRGRYTVALFKNQMKPNEIKKWLKGRNKQQNQPRLFVEHTRRVKMAGGNLQGLGAHLLMLGREDKNGRFKVEFFEPSNPLSLKDPECIKKLEGDWDSDRPNLQWKKTSLDWGDRDKRMVAANNFWNTGICAFFREMVEFCDLTGTSLHIKFDLLIEHLVAYVSGLKGNRSGARGYDLYSKSGHEVEIKSAVGWKGDGFGTEDTPRWDLGIIKNKKSQKRARLMRWRRLYMVRMLLPKIGEELELSLQIHEEKTTNPSQSFHQILANYGFTTQLNINASAKLYEPQINLGLKKKGDGLRQHRMQEVCRFTEGTKKVNLGKHFKTGTSEPQKCSCKYCSEAWVKAFYS